MQEYLKTFGALLGIIVVVVAGVRGAYLIMDDRIDERISARLALIEEKLTRIDASIRWQATFVSVDEKERR